MTIRKGRTAKTTATATATRKGRTVQAETTTATVVYAEKALVDRLSNIVESQAKAIELLNARIAVYCTLTDRYDAILKGLLSQAQTTANNRQPKAEETTATEGPKANKRQPKAEETTATEEHTGPYLALLDFCVDDVLAQCESDAKVSDKVTVLCNYDLRRCMTSEGRKAIKAYRESHEGCSLTTLSKHLVEHFNRENCEVKGKPVKAKDIQPLTVGGWKVINDKGNGEITNTRFVLDK
jgi:hypothetical protein